MFSESLELKLDLTIKNSKFKILGGNIKNFQVDLYNYGFKASLDFWTHLDKQEDNIFSSFITADPIEVRLSIAGYHNLPSPAPQPLILRGLVTNKTLKEITSDQIDQPPIACRHYTIHFADPASVLWQKHFPLAVYVDSKMSDVLKGQVAEGITLKMDWDVLEVERPLLCLGLGNPKNKASFYDFVLWFIHSQNGVWNYDSQKGVYEILKEKKSSESPLFIDFDEVEKIEIPLPGTLRCNTKILNGHSEKAKIEEISQDQSVSGIHRDVLFRSPIESDFTHQKTLEADRLKIRQSELVVHLKQFPTITFRTGTLIRFEKGLWSREIYPKGKEYRVYRVQLQGQAVDQSPEDDRDLCFTAYQISMTARLELKDEPHVNLPPFQKPYYPFYVEGKIVSEGGKDEDKTYQIYEDKKNSLEYYKVNLPLWNQKILLPFQPNFHPGHFYFPAFKHSRVLVALDFQQGEIAKFLEWGHGTRLPMDTQGNHILFGKNATSQTSLKHIYQDNKPCIVIKRICEKDTEMIQLKEGTLIFQTKEEEMAKKTSEKFDVTPRVASAKGELSMKTGAAISGITADFQATKSLVMGQLESTIGDTRTALDDMDSELSGKASQVRGEVSSAFSAMDESTARLKTSAQAIKSELKDALKL